MLKHMPPGRNDSVPPPPSNQNRPSRGHNRSGQQLNISTLSTPGPPFKIANGYPPRMSSIINTTPLTSISSLNKINKDSRLGAREALTSLGLLCLVSLLLALLSLIFLLKISPGSPRDPPTLPSNIVQSPEDYAIVYDVTLALCALSLSLNLCCLLVCAIQFLFAVKLVRAPTTNGRGNKYLQKSSVSRVCAVGGFFISIPIFLTGIILYTFTEFQSTPAIVTSALIGIGIVFCGGAMVHNVFIWQKEKTICVRQNMCTTPQLNLNLSTISPPAQFLNGNHIHLNHSHSNGLQQHPITPLTPLSPNHSHNISFNHSYVPSFGVRANTATPPTPNPKIPSIGGGLTTRELANGSVSPGANLDVSNVTTNSLHELSTLV